MSPSRSDKSNLPSPEEALDILSRVRTRRTPAPPPPARRAVGPVLKALDARFSHLDTEVNRIKPRWNEIVGESTARLCEPVRVIPGRAKGTAGTLELRCETVYAPLLQHQSDLILGRVNLFLGSLGGCSKIAKIRLIQGMARLNPAPDITASKRPLSAMDEWRLQQSLEDITDKRLKATLLKLGRGVLAQGEARKRAHGDKG